MPNTFSHLKWHDGIFNVKYHIAILVAFLMLYIKQKKQKTKTKKLVKKQSGEKGVGTARKGRDWSTETESITHWLKVAFILPSGLRSSHKNSKDF